MAGPNYNVGITFLASDKASKAIALLQKRLEKLIVVARAAEKSVANIAKSAERITAAQIAMDKKTVSSAKAASREKIRIKHFEERQATKTAAMGERERLRSSKLSIAAQSAATLAATKQKSAEEMASIKADTARHRLEMLKRREEERRVSARKVGSKGVVGRVERFIGRGVGYATGGYGGGIVGGGVGSALASVGGTGLGIAAAGVTAYLVAGTYAADQYGKALAGLETAGMNAADAMKVLGSTVLTSNGAMKYATVSQGGQLAAMIASSSMSVPNADIANLVKSSAKELTFLRTGMGMPKDQAMNTLWALKKSLQLGLSSQGLQGGALSKTAQQYEDQIIRRGAVSGISAPDYFTSISAILTDPKLMTLMKPSQTSGLISAMAPLTLGGMKSSDFAAFAKDVRGGASGMGVVQRMMMSGGMGVQDIRSIIAGNRFKYKGMEQVLSDPYGYANRVLIPALRAQIPGFSGKSRSEQRRAVMSRAEQVLPPEFARLVESVMRVSPEWYEQLAKGASKLSDMQNKVAVAELKLEAATSKLLQAFSNTAGIAAMNKMADLINSLTTPAAAATPSAGAAAALAPVGGVVMRMFGLLWQQMTQHSPIKKESFTPQGIHGGSAGMRPVSVTINAKTTSSAKEIAGMVHTALKNITSGGGVYTSSPLAGVSV